VSCEVFFKSKCEVNSSNFEIVHATIDGKPSVDNLSHDTVGYALETRKSDFSFAPWLGG
jgi:hypothetical protein